MESPLLRLFLLVVVTAGWTSCVEVRLPDGSRLLGLTSFSTRSRRPIYEFRGLRYARAPGGPNRFKASQPAEPVPEYNANWFGPPCPQAFSPLEMDIPWYTRPDPEALASVRHVTAADDPEDCLYLNVYTTKVGRGSTPMPVLVFVHGGSFVIGSSMVARPGFLLDHDLVLVVPQYRLASLGFLYLGTEDAPGNMALSDVLQALRWVQTNIREFGGDPNRITLAGNSAGGGIAELIALSPKSQGLVRQVLTVSGSAHGPWAVAEGPQAAAGAHRVAELSGCNASDAAAVVACLRNRTLHNVTIAYRQYCVDQMSADRSCLVGASPVIQGSWLSSPVLERRPADVCDSRLEFVPRPMMGSVTKHDGYSFAHDLVKKEGDLSSESNGRHFIEYYMHRALNIDYSPVLGSALFEVYFKPDRGNKEINYTVGLTDFIGATQFKGPLMAAADCNAAHGGKSYLYTYSHRGKHNKQAIEHATDLVYIFPRSDYKLSKEEDRVSKRLVHLIANFVIYGEPTPNVSLVEGVPRWKPYSAERGEYMRVDWPFSALEHFEQEFTVTMREGLSVAPVMVPEVAAGLVAALLCLFALFWAH